MPAPCPITADEAISMIEAVQVRKQVPLGIAFEWNLRDAVAAIYSIENSHYENCTFYKYEETPEFKEIISKAGNFLYDRKSGLIILNMSCKHQMLSSVLFWLYNPKGKKMKQGLWEMDDADAFYESGYGFYRSSCASALYSSVDYPLTSQEKFMFDVHVRKPRQDRY